jgi:hypothetical protein
MLLLLWEKDDCRICRDICVGVPPVTTAHWAGGCHTRLPSTQFSAKRGVLNLYNVRIPTATYIHVLHYSDFV